MKYLNYYKKQGLRNPNEVFDFFMNNLQRTIITWEFFVEWSKIRDKVESIEKELRLLNSLLGKKNTTEKFIELIKEYPKTKKALSLLIAVRQNKLRNTYVVDKSDIGKSVEDWEIELKNEYFKIRKELDDKTIEELREFYKVSGLKEVFERKDISNLVDYYFGIEVGMDTHARKNRKGVAMENIVRDYLEKDYKQVLPQATKEKIDKQCNFSLELNGIKANKAFDFAVLSKSKLFLVETNYYSVGGTKLKSTAREYKDYQRFLNKEGIGFIWVTDGLGWKSSRNPLKETFLNNDYVFNLKMVSEGVLSEVIQL